MILAADVATHAYSSHRTVAFERIELVVPGDVGWAGGHCAFLGGPSGDTRLPCAVLAGISCGGAPFTIFLSDGAEERHGPFEVEGLTTSFPIGADCFLYSERESDGFWVGHTVATAFRRLVVRAYECDPA